MKYCTECGSKNSAMAKFCQSCGTPFGGTPLSKITPAKSQGFEVEDDIEESHFDLSDMKGLDADIVSDRKYRVQDLINGGVPTRIRSANDDGVDLLRKVVERKVTEIN